MSLESGPGRSPETVIAERAQDLIVLWTQDAKKWCEFAADILSNYGHRRPDWHKQGAEAYIALHNDNLGAGHFRKMVADAIREKAESDAESEYEFGELQDYPAEQDDGRGGAL